MLITVLVPVLNRPQNAATVLQSLRLSTDFRRDIELVFIASPQDLAQIHACRQAVALDRSQGGDSRMIYSKRPPEEGHDYSRKMNIGFAETEGEWVLLGSDDVTYEPGWETELLRVAEETGKSVIGSNDMANRLVYRHHLFSTHTLVKRSYAEDPGASLDGPGRIVTEAYDHNFPDRELAGLAMYRDEWAFAPNAIIRHRHPGFGTAKQDATYEKGRASLHEDQLIFWDRAARWDNIGLIAQELTLLKRSKLRIAKAEATARARKARGG